MGSSCCKQKTDNRGTLETLSYEQPGRKGENLISWQADYKTQKYHWWPMKKTDESISIHNNLYAKGGCLNKYDDLFDTLSRKYQMENYYRGESSTLQDAGWAGFCDKATILSSLYEYPEKPVKVIFKNKEIIFTPKDIEGLMIIAADNSTKVGISLFFGHRNNGKRDNKEEPYPSDLVHMLKIMSMEGGPFAMDVDKGSAVWNYSFDEIEVTKTVECPLDCKGIIPTDGITTYYNFIINSAAYPEQNMDIWGYNNISYVKNEITNDLVHVVTEGWVSNKHPDFLWKYYKKQTEWYGNCITNPEVDANIVYQLYKHSFYNGCNDIVFNDDCFDCLNNNDLDDDNQGL
jgi:hypothetical protein